MTDLTRVRPIDKIGYSVFAGDVHNYEVWLARHGHEKIAFINGFETHVDAHKAAKRYREAREVARGLEWRP